jgi:hypothetical protein
MESGSDSSFGTDLINRSPVNGTLYEEPVGTTEQAIAGVWCELFGSPQIGRNDNFFELGGNSILGMQLLEKIATRLSIQLPLVALLLNPTIREIAQYTVD